MSDDHDVKIAVPFKVWVDPAKLPVSVQKFIKTDKTYSVIGTEGPSFLIAAEEGKIISVRPSMCAFDDFAVTL